MFFEFARSVLRINVVLRIGVVFKDCWLGMSIYFSFLAFNTLRWPKIYICVLYYLYLCSIINLRVALFPEWEMLSNFSNAIFCRGLRLDWFLSHQISKLIYSTFITSKFNKLLTGWLLISDSSCRFKMSVLSFKLISSLTSQARDKVSTTDTLYIWGNKL